MSTKKGEKSLKMNKNSKHVYLQKKKHDLAHIDMAVCTFQIQF